MAKIVFDNGIKTYDIEDEKGNLRGQISFNPADINMFKRYEAVEKAVEDAYTVFAEADRANADYLKLFEETDTNVKNKINEFFDDMNASNVIFGSQHVFNMHNGKTLLERFMTMIMPVIKADFKEEYVKSQERIEKYTEQVSE